MANPTISELQNSDKFELIAELDHQQIKDFVINQLIKGGRLVKSFMVYQIIMIVFGIIVIIRSIQLAFTGDIEPLKYTIAGGVFCFTALIIIHELLHGIALKITGAAKVNYGAYLKRFIFYAEADQHILNKKQFTLVALAPLAVVKIVSILAIIILYSNSSVFFVALVMSIHSLFCAGDIGLLSMFYNEKDSEYFTYDVRAERKSYFYKRI